jgi:hypothetical protein
MKVPTLAFTGPASRVAWLGAVCAGSLLLTGVAASAPSGPPLTGNESVPPGAGSLLLTGVAASAPSGPPLTSNESVPPGARIRGPSTVDLSSGKLREAVERLQTGLGPPSGVEAVGNRIRVEIIHSLGAEAIKNLVGDLGGADEGTAAGGLAQALVPFDRLVELEHRAGVAFIRPPLRASEPLIPTAGQPSRAPAAPSVVGEEVAFTNASAWHANGHKGQGVRVGIVDGFGGDFWDNAQQAGELPAPAGTFCRANGAACDIWALDQPHGEGVAEIVHEMAPNAQLYLAQAFSTADLGAAVNYFFAQGVDIVTRSLTSEYDGPGDGTGGIANVINNATANQITWFNSAGNSAGRSGSYQGSYWRGSWSDPDSDGWINFTPTDEAIGFTCGFINGVRWNDWGAGRTDYDIYVYDEADLSLESFLASSENDQTSGAPPLEHPSYTCNQASPTDFMVIRLFNTGSGVAGDILEFMTNGLGIEYWQNPYSITGPAADTASPGALSIGAIDPANGSTIAPYSSQGPSNDERTLPDISAVACVASYTYSPGCFAGTSASTPVAAGAAALVFGAGLATVPSQLKTYLKTSAFSDRGAPGPDNVYGVGELILPAPPSPTAVKAATFRAARTTAGTLLRWTTASETGIAGFNVYRGGVRANRALIAARGAVSGAGYRLVDRTGRIGATYTYRLQAVGLDGTRSWIGSATVAG